MDIGISDHAVDRVPRGTRARLALHHVGYAVAHLEPATKQYAERFGYEVMSPVIHDPHQTALVQFLRLAGDSTYLEFVSPDGPQSKLMRAVQKGGGLNHLCYSTADLEASLAELHASGMLIIGEPAPAVAFGGRRIAWLIGEDRLPIELVEAIGDEPFGPTPRLQPALD
jgi:methylmalonyl-CoA/ethylmalonyl-CoA epimerase